MKKISFLLALVISIGAMAPTAHAAAPDGSPGTDVSLGTEIVHTELGDLEVESTLSTSDTVYSIWGDLYRLPMRRIGANIKSAHKSQTVKYDGEVIAVVGVFATFCYDGKSSRPYFFSNYFDACEDWRLRNIAVTTRGGAVFLSAELSRSLYRSIALDMSLTCSPTGQIS